MTLYGFADSDTRDLFQTLLSVSGVGPRLAMATLAVHEAPALRQVLADGDVTALTRVPGIGKRSAERMVLELRDKVGPARPCHRGAPATNGHAVRGPVVEALVGLGFAAKQAEEATDRVLAGETARPPRRVRCGPRCRCWVRRNDPVRADRRGRRARGVRGAHRRRGRHRRQPAAAVAGRVHRPAARARAAAAGHRGRQEPRRHPGSHPAVRSAGARQDVAGDDHRPRAGQLAAADVGSCAGARRRPGRDAVEPGRPRRAVHRRDPPHRPARRGNAVPGDGGLPGRRRRRQGARGDVDSARSRAVHARRRHHPVRRAHRPAARPVRVHRAHGLLRAGRTRAGAAPVGGHPGHRVGRRRGRRDRPPLARHAAHRQPAAAAGPRLRGSARRRRDHPRASPRPRWRSTTSTNSGWTGWTAPC